MTSKITIRTLAGTTNEIEVKNNALISDLKDAVNLVTAIPPTQQLLKLATTTLEPDAKCILEFGIGDGTTIELFVQQPRARGKSPE